MKKLILDTLERTAAAYVTTLLGLLFAEGVDATDLGVWKAAALAAIPAALSVLKAAVGASIGDRTTVAWLPRAKL